MEKIGHILHECFQDFGIQKPLKRYRIFYLWPEIVGKKVAKVTIPQKVSNKKIFIKVKNDVWRQEITFLKSEIIQKINKELGSNEIKDIVLY